MQVAQDKFLELMKSMGGGTSPLNTNINQQIDLAKMETPDEKFAGRLEGMAGQFQQHTPATAIISGLMQGVASGKRSKAEREREARLAALQPDLEYVRGVHKAVLEAHKIEAKKQAADMKAMETGMVLADSLQALEMGDEGLMRNYLAANQEIANLLGDDGPGGASVDGARVVTRNGAKYVQAYGRGVDGQPWAGQELPFDGLLQRYAPEVYKQRTAEALDAQKQQLGLQKTQAEIEAVQALRDQRAGKVGGVVEKVTTQNPDGTTSTVEMPTTMTAGEVRAEKMRQQALKSKASLDTAIQKQNNTIAKIDEAIGNAGDLWNLLNPFDGKTATTSIGGQILSGVGGTGARDMAANLDTIKANVGFDELTQMRQNSPTGGALGQVSERENVLLQSVLASLDQSQSKEQFIKNLQNVKQQIMQGQERLKSAYNETFGQFGLDRQTERVNQASVMNGAAQNQAATVAQDGVVDLLEGKTATNPQTGEKLIRKGGQWIPVQ